VWLPCADAGRAAPTSLALTTALLGTQLPPGACKRHVALFAAATPAGALLAYAAGALARGRVPPAWTGLAMLVSGGSFLYVATVLQPVAGHADAQGVRGVRRLLLLLAGMAIPWLIATFVGHDH
jgi:zinc transporter 9